MLMTIDKAKGRELGEYNCLQKKRASVRGAFLICKILLYGVMG